jgi:L-lactate utilization protein LutB
MVYDHVGRALLGGVYSGSAGSVPTTITDGQTITKSFTYTVPATSNKANMKAVAILIDQTTGEIVNANDVALSASGISELTAEELSVYPNPASDLVNVSFDANNADYSVALMDLQGRVVSSKELTNANGAQEVSFATSNIAKGSYIVVVSSNGAKTTKTVVIK